MLLLLVYGMAQLLVAFRCHEQGFDSSIYLGMARYIRSLGAVGFFEPLRPLLLPSVIAVGEALGAGVAGFGRLVAVLSSVGVIALVYAVTLRLSDRRAALFAALVMAGTRVFLLYSPQVLTGIPSTLLALGAFYAFLNQRLFLCGMLAGLAFMTRFPQGLLLVIYGSALGVQFAREPAQRWMQLRRALWALLGFALPVTAFLAFNVHRYAHMGPLRGALWPFLHGSQVVAEAGSWLFGGSWFFYLEKTIGHNPCYAVVPLALWVLWRERSFRWREHGVLCLAALCFLVYFSRHPHKEIRFALVFLPYLATLAGVGLRWLDRDKHPRCVRALAYLLLIASLTSVKSWARHNARVARDQPQGTEIADCIRGEGYRGKVLASVPYVLPYLDNPVEARFVPAHFLERLGDSRTQMVVHAPWVFVYAPDDSDGARIRGGIEERLTSDYILLFTTTSPRYPMQVYRRRHSKPYK